MKQIKKFLGVFLALAMVIGTIGMMPAIQTKAEIVGSITASIETPTLGQGVTSLVINFSSAAQHETISGMNAETKANSFIDSIKKGSDDITVSDAVNSFTITGTKTAITKITVTIPETTFIAGDKIVVTFKTNLVHDGSNPFTTVTLAIPEPEEPGEPGNTAFPSTVPTVAFNADKLTLTVSDPATEDKAQFVFVGIPVTNAKGTSVKAYDVFEMKNGTIDIDLSTYGVKKDVTLWIHFGNGTLEKNDYIKEVKILKNTKAIKAVFDYATEKFVLTYKEGTSTVTVADADVPKFEYRTGASSTWADCSVNDLKKAAEFASMYASTIYFREKAVVEAVEIPASEGTPAVPAVENTFPSAEAKIKIAKQGNAPKVAIDYVKGTVSFPKGVQVYGLLGTSIWIDFDILANSKELITAAGVAVDPTKAAVMNVEDIGGGAADLLFYVRTAVTVNKTTNVGTKPISKIQAVVIGAQAAAPIYPGTETDTQDIKFEAVLTRGVLSGVKLTNVSGATIQYKLGTDAWKNLLDEKFVTLALTKLEDKEILFRFAGVKNESLPSSSKTLQGNDIVSTVTPKKLVWEGMDFTETSANDGAVASTGGKATLTGATFVDSIANNAVFVEGTHYTVVGTDKIPADLTLVVQKISTTVANLKFTGTATAHEATNSVTTGLTIVFLPAAFTDGVTVEGNVATPIKITFDDAATGG